MIRKVRAALPLAIFATFGCEAFDSRPEQARAILRRTADELDAQTTKTGSYVRDQQGMLAQTDPWGTKLRLAYSSGGVAEELNVSSAGPDKEFDTDDDIAEQRMTATLAGVGEGIKENVGEVAKNAASGAVEGAVDGMKKAVKANLPKFGSKKPKDDAGDSPVEQ
jgi:hypothetical protein